MTNYFVIGDIHGKLHAFLTLLNQWKPKEEQLILLGDLVDRGSQSRQVIQAAMTLQKEHGAIVLKGNHDDMFLEWLQNPEAHYYYSQGGDVTVNSFFGTRMTTIYHPDHLATLIKESFPEEIAFLTSLPDYYDAEPFIMVHAGVDLDMLDWKETDTQDFKWIRHDFHYGKNQTGRTILFGHTPTHFLNPNQSTDVFISPCRTKIGLDGGCVFGGFLHALRIKDNQPDTIFSVDKDLKSYGRPYSMLIPQV